MKRSDVAGAILVFMAACTLYVRTLAPSLLFGDSAEFQTIAYTLGMGHPTGYPVYILLGKVFTFFPIANIAYRVNLFSAFCAAVAVALLYLILRSLDVTPVAALCGLLVPALDPVFWKYASMAEVYAPAMACLMFVLFAVFQWKKTYNSRWLFAAGLFGGLSLGIHTMVAIGGIAVLLFLLLSTRSRADWLRAILGTLMGSVIFLASFLFLDSINSPAGYYHTVVRPSLSLWDMTPADFDSPFERLAFLYFPPQFKGAFFAVSSNEVMNRLTDFLHEISWILWLAVPGFGYLLFRGQSASARWREAALLAFIAVSFLVYGATYNVFDYYVYDIAVLLVLGIFAGLGIHALLTAVGTVPKTPRLLPTGFGIIILMLVIYRSSGAVTTSWRERIPPGLDDWEAYYFHFPEMRMFEASQTVNHLEDNAIVFTDWDRTYGFYYAAHITQGRTHISFHEAYPQEGVSQFAESAVDYIEANIDRRPIYFSERPSQLANQYKITRAGSGLFQIERK